MDVFEYLLLLLVFFVGLLGGGAVVLDWTYRWAEAKAIARRCADPPAGSQRWNRGNGRARSPEHYERSAVFPAILLVPMRLSAAALVLLVLIPARRTIRVFGER